MSLKRTRKDGRAWSEILCSTPKDEKAIVNTSKSLSLSEINSGSSSSDNVRPSKNSVNSERLPKKKVPEKGTKKPEPKFFKHILPLRSKHKGEGRSTGSSWETVYQDEVQTSPRISNKPPSNICASGSPEQTRDSKFTDVLSLDYSIFHGIIEDANRSDLGKIDEDFTEEPLPLPPISPRASDIYDHLEDFDPSKVIRTYPPPRKKRNVSPKDPLRGKWPFRVRWPVATANALWEKYVEENREVFSRDFPHVVNGLRRQESDTSSDSDDKDIVESSDPYEMYNSQSERETEDVRGDNGELLPFRAFVERKRKREENSRIRIKIRQRLKKRKEKKKPSRKLGRKRRYNFHTTYGEDTSEDSNAAKNAEIPQSTSVNNLLILSEPRAYSSMSDDSYQFLDRAATTANIESLSGRSDVEQGSSQETLIYRLPNTRGRRKRGPIELDTESDEYNDDKENKDNVQLQDSDDPYGSIRQSTKFMEANKRLVSTRSASRTLGEGSDNTIYPPERKKLRITFQTENNFFSSVMRKDNTWDLTKTDNI